MSTLFALVSWLAYVELAYVELAYVELAYVKLGYIELAYVELAYVELGYVELGYVELGYVELAYIELGYVELAYVELGYVELAYVELAYIELGYVELAYVELGYVELAYVELGYVELGYVELAYVELAYVELGTLSCGTLSWGTLSWGTLSWGTLSWGTLSWGTSSWVKGGNCKSQSKLLTWILGTIDFSLLRPVVQYRKIDQPSFGMPGQKYYLVSRNDTMLMAYENLIFSTCNLMGLANQSNATEEVKAVVDFEIKLANISVPDEQRRDRNALYNPMTLAEIQGNYSRHFNWSRYVVELLSSPEVGVTDISESEIIINQSPVYYRKLNDLLDVTPKRTVANYLIWRLVLPLLKLGALGEKYKTLLNNYNKVILGTSSERPRFRTCSTYTARFMSLAVGRMFVKDHFDMDSKTIVLNMVKGLQNSFDDLLEDLDWMDDETKKVAKDKNHFINSKIGYPEELNNDTYLEEFYSNLTFNKEMFFENIFINQRESFYKNLRQLRLPIDKAKWNTPPPTVGAKYSSDMNQIFFPAGILQPPFFSKTYPK
ncbi:Membrane metallo-endopeptidase-like 1 [Bulinus truncatus]|nr:Membrane metallo-endopeptidase-like 1 [Bulinus truncatus]